MKLGTNATVEKKLEILQGKAEQATSMYTGIINGLKSTNSELEAVKEEAVNKAKYYSNIADNATIEIARNNAVIVNTEKMLL